VNFQIRRIEPIAEPLLVDQAWDYADSFEVLLDQPDDHSAQEWIQAAVGRLGDRTRRLVMFVHRRIVRFDFGRDDENGLLGWSPLVTGHDVTAVQADGPIVRAVLVARRQGPARCTSSTYLFFHKQGQARLMWMLVRPLHLEVERRLLAGAASTICARTSERPMQR